MDIEALAEDVAEAVRSHVAPLKAQLAALVAEVAMLRERAPVNGVDGQAGKDGRDGVDGKDGENGLHGKDGRDGSDGARGEKGEDGAPATVDLIELADMLRKEPEFVAMCKGDAGPKGADGSPGRDGLNGRDGMNGERGIQGERGFDGENGRDGRDGKDGSIGDRGVDGERGPIGDRGDQGMQGKDGAPGTDGRDGFSLEDFHAETKDGGRTILLSFTSGDLRKSIELRTACVIDAGPFKPSASYLRGDAVTYGGQLYIAQADTINTKPGDSKDWRLAARKGADGKDA